jgi:hypothetical protein
MMLASLYVPGFAQPARCNVGLLRPALPCMGCLPPQAEGHVAALRKLFDSPQLGCKALNLGTGTGQTVMEVGGLGGLPGWQGG